MLSKRFLARIFDSRKLNSSVYKSVRGVFSAEFGASETGIGLVVIGGAIVEPASSLKFIDDGVDCLILTSGQYQS